MELGARYQRVFADISKRWWFLMAVGVWTLISVYDTTLSQLVPDDTAKKLPKTWQVAVMTGNLLPWWGWALTLAGIVIVALLEYAVRAQQSHASVASSAQVALVPDTTPPDDQDKAALARGYNRATFKCTPGEKAAILRLTQLRDEGVVIRNYAVAGTVNAETLEPWLRDVARWMRDVIEALRRVDEAKAEYFKTLDIVENARVQAPVLIQNPADAKRFVNGFNQHDQRLVCLRDILKPYIFQ